MGVHIRAIHTTDEAELLQAFERLSPEARYMRFMRAVRAPDLHRLRKALSAFPESGVGLVATVPAADGIDIVGSAVCFVGAEPVRGEFAISVAGNYGGAGLGQRDLIDAALVVVIGRNGGFALAQHLLDAAGQAPGLQHRPRSRGPHRLCLPAGSRGVCVRQHELNAL
ncbi:MAG: hypothetical protein U5L03_13325, partial [Burkholderiaceae bacterium]|nr:hypothetical protein [Burkholderiaceae bacterium]